MPKRMQKREGRSEEKRRAEDTSSSLERADLRGLLRLDSSLQVHPHRDRLTGIIRPVRKNL
jgi:hypothetical protein